MFIVLTGHFSTLTETIDTARLRSLGFNVLETARLTDKKENSVNFVNHGGVAVIARQGFSIAKIDLKTKVITIEYLAVRVTSKGASSIVIVVYRPGSARPDTHFFSEFNKFLGAVAAFSTSVTIVGDINIRLDRPEMVIQQDLWIFSRVMI